MEQSDAEMDEMVVCERAPDLAAAQLLAASLRGAGLHPLVADENTAGLAWHLSGALGGIRIMVPAGELEVAKEVLTAELGSEEEEGDEAEDTPGASAAHRAFKVAVVGTLLFFVQPFALWLGVKALRSGNPSQSGATRRAVFAVIISATHLTLLAVAGFFVLRDVTTARPLETPLSNAQSAAVVAEPAEAADAQDAKVEDASSRAAQQRACDKGNAEACYELGIMWGNGTDGPISQAQAVHWVKHACDLGHGPACEFLPDMAAP